MRYTRRINTHELLARERKADKLAAAIRSRGHSGTVARTFDDQRWRLYEAAADVKASSEETRKRVIEILEGK